MNISIKATGKALAADSRVLAEGKLRALEKRLGENAGTALLECEIEESIAAVRAGARYRAEGTLKVNGKVLRAEATNASLEGAIDRVRDELARELRKASGKSRERVKQGGAALKRRLRRS